jgi:type II secretory pathway pseudopilin PulG
MAEMVIVVMIMGIATAVAAPAFLNSLAYHRLEAAAQRVRVDIELARHTARLTSTTQSITFAGTTYTMSAGSNHMDSPTAPYVVKLGDSPFEVESVTANFNNGQVVSFNGYGAPAASGTVVLTANGRSATVTVDANTGNASVSGVSGI